MRVLGVRGGAEGVPTVLLLARHLDVEKYRRLVYSKASSVTSPLAETTSNLARWAYSIAQSGTRLTSSVTKRFQLALRPTHRERRSNTFCTA